MTKERDYILGTHDEELERLGLQHRVWRPTVLKCWERAGIARGSRVLDVGAGPGYAAADLSDMVGPEGTIIALERSEKFLRALRERNHAHGTENIAVHQLDLVEEEFPAGGCDFSWCRWVMCFVAQPEVVLGKIARALRPGGRAIFHEYVDYATWSFLPPRPAHRKFVEAVMKSWRASGGEPDIARLLPEMLTRHSCKIVSLRSLSFAVRARDEMWQWPSSFIQSGAARLQELGYLDAVAIENLHAEFRSAEHAGTPMLMPLVLEIVAERLEIAE